MEKKELKIGTLNVGSMSARGHELVDLMERRKIKIMCLQETKWKGSKAKELGNGFKLFYVGEDGKRNGVGIVLDDELKKSVLEVRRPSDRIIWMKVEMEQQVVNIMSAYAPQAGCTGEEKEKFWEEIEEELRRIPTSEKLWIGGDFNGHVGSENTGREEALGIYGHGELNDGGEALVAFAVSHNLRLVNTYFKKPHEHKITYRSGRAESQIDYILSRASDKNIKDCKAIPGEAITNQHRPVVCTMKIEPTRTQKKPGIPKTKWWKLSEREPRENFVDRVKQQLQERPGVQLDWEQWPAT